MGFNKSHFSLCWILWPLCFRSWSARVEFSVGWVFCGFPVAATDSFDHRGWLTFTQSLFRDRGGYRKRRGKLLTEGDCALLGKDVLVALELLPSQLTQGHCLNRAMLFFRQTQRFSVEEDSISKERNGVEYHSPSCWNKELCISTFKAFQASQKPNQSQTKVPRFCL